MGRRGAKKRGRAVHGWVVLDKPYGMGSTQAVAAMRRMFNAQKAGHAGTLDPLASGMLPIALGNATRTVPYVMDGTKVYRFDVTWGAETTTDDLEGEVTNTSDKRPSREEIEALLPQFTGAIQQLPPQFSAVKIDGKRAYDVARSGEKADIKPREVEIDEFTIEDCPSADVTTFEVVCGKGTYVRSLARDMGQALGCYGHITALRRLEVFPFAEEEMIALDDLDAAHNIDREAREATEESDAIAPPPAYTIDQYLTAPEAALTDMPEIMALGDHVEKLKRGAPIFLRGTHAPTDADEAYATHKGKLIAIGYIEHGQFVPKRVFE